MTAGLFERNCASKDCDRPAGWLTNVCPVHDVISTAKQMSSEDLAAMKALLPGVSPMSDEERQTRKVSAALASIATWSRHHEDAVNRALAVGATAEQVAIAQAEAVSK